MSDAGLEEAIRAAGGVGELARRIGISQPSVSNWSRIPAGRVLAVEAATGVVRSVLRPDLYSAAAPSSSLNEVDAARAREYALLAHLLLQPAGSMLLTRLAKLPDDGTPLGHAHAELAEAAREATPEAVEREFFELFIGVGRGELLPYASFYLTGFLHERPLARLREDLRALGIERIEDQSEPEDHAGVLCEVMSGLIRGPFAAEADRQQRVFDRHIAPWLKHFFVNLEAAHAARFYRPVGIVGRLFIEIETEVFALPA
jgi:TorA maturation chaperone TorD